MFGIPLDTLVVWANVISLSGLGIAMAGTIVAYHLSARMNGASVRELQQVQSEARSQIENARAQAARESARNAELTRANAQFQLDLQLEKDARLAVSEQFQPRDMTKDQLARFIESVKGKIVQLNLLTVPDPEASAFGVTVLDALRKAGVSVNWYRMQSATPVEGAASTGVIVYEYPQGGDESAGRTLLKAFTEMNMQSSLLAPVQPLHGVPSPSLIIALKPPEFLRPSDHPIPPDIKPHNDALSDLLSRAE